MRWSANPGVSEAVDGSTTRAPRTSGPHLPPRTCQRAEQARRRPTGAASPTGRFQKMVQIDLEGRAHVLALRSKYAEPKKNLTDPNTYYDPSFYRSRMR